MRSTKTQFTKVYRSLCLMLAIVAGLTANALAQGAAARPDRGIRPVGSYSETDIESVSLNNGNVNLSIPLASLPPVAGGKLGLTVSASYNSKLWDIARREVASSVMGNPNFVQDVPQLSLNGGWRIGGTYSIAFHSSLEDFVWLPPTDPNDSEYCLLNGNRLGFLKAILTTPDGSTHELRPLDYLPYQHQTGHDYLWGYYLDQPDNTCTNPQLCPPSGCTTATMRYYSFDGSFLWAKIYPSGGSIAWEIFLQDGTHIIQRNTGGNKGQNIWDRNGLDRIRIWSESTDPTNPAYITTHYVDTMSSPTREIKYVGDATGEHIQYQTAGGTWMSIGIVRGQTTVSGKTYAVLDEFNNGQLCWRQYVLGQNIEVIRSIVLPITEPGQGQGRSFSFSYTSDSTEQFSQSWQGLCGATPAQLTTASIGWGSLSSMTTPAGATVNYTYKMDHVHILHPPGESYENADLPRDSITHKSAAHDGIVDNWDYSIGFVGGLVTAHVAGQPDETTTEFCYNHDPGFGDLYGGVDGLGGISYRTNHSGKEIVDRHWILKKFYGASDLMPGTLIHPPFNPVVDAEYTTVVDPNNSANNKMSAKLYQYDYNGNMTSETDYDWFNANTVGTDTYGVPTGVPGGVAVLRTSTTSYYSPAPVSSDPSPGSANVYARRLLADGSPTILNAAKETTAAASDTLFSYDGGNWPSGPILAGNLTKVERRDNRANKWLGTNFVYDSMFGNLTTSTDSLGNVTTYGYDANTHAQPTSITVDPLNGTGSQTTQTVYDFYTGLVTSQTDANLKTTNIYYTNQRLGTVDPYGRPGLVSSPAVTSIIDGVTYSNQSRQAVTKYYDNASPNNAFQVEVISDLNQQGDGLLKARTTKDQMGRALLTETSENGSTYTISGRTVYDPMGRVTYSTNPYRSGAASTDGWTRATRDNAGRVTEVATFNTATQPPSTGTNGNWTGSVTTSYNAEATTVTDQAGKSRKSIIDGLGRLKQVVEDPNGSTPYTTTYGYDTLGDLTSVAQGAQTRTFTYDSLSRLREASNPEQVNTSNQQIQTVYLYDDGSNLTRKTNPSGSYASFAYDGLNRVKSKTLSTGGVWNYNYDTAANGKGRLTSVALQGGTDGNYYDGYDAVGKITASHQTTTAQSGAQSYSFTYGYNLAGGMTKQVYPSGREIRTSYDNAGRVAGVKNQASGLYYAGAPSTDSANRIQYSAHGAMGAMKLGSGRWEHTSFNGRLQPTQIGFGTTSSDSSVMRLDYTYGTTNNNGNVQTQNILAPTTAGGTATFSQSYQYDALNRLQVATEAGGWTQTYDCDRYGNRAVRNTSYIPNPQLTPQSTSAADFSAFNQNTNRLVASSYDTSGNQTTDAAGRTFTYDAENHQLTFNTTAGTYSYDGDGRRVKKTDSTGTTVFVYNAASQLIAEYTSVNPVSTNGVSYLTSDHLGSTRLVTDINGYERARHDYLPFGEELPSNVGSRSSVTGYGAVDGVRQKFTGKERDNESGLDYFDARYYSSAQGRFTSPDEFTGGPDELYNFAASASDNPTFYADLHEPQSLNKYQYCNNNPLSSIDPDGHQGRWTEAQKAKAQAYSRIGNCAKNVGIGSLKSGANLFIGINNFMVDLGFKCKSISPYQEKGDCQGVAMDITNQAAVILPLLGGEGPVGVLTADAEETTIVTGEVGASIAGRSKTAAEMASDLSNQAGQNSVRYKTPDKAGHIDLRGKTHFDKATEQNIATPHVQERSIHRGPAGQVNLGKQTTRPATKADIRTARKLLQRQK